MKRSVMPYKPYDLKNKKHVFIDWSLIEPGYGLSFGGEQSESWEMPSGVLLKPHLPRLDRIPLISPDKPWEHGNAKSGMGVYSTLFEDDGRYRLYYDSGDESGVLEAKEELGTQRTLAYAESTDGIHWVKPNLGIVSFNGSRNNNIIYGLDASPGRDAHGSSVFKDPSAPPEAKYKMVHQGAYQGRFAVLGAISADGLHWKMIEKPLISTYLNDVQTGVCFNPEKNRYVGYFRGWTHHEHLASHGRRTITYAETDCFEKWPVPRTVVETDMLDRPDTDIYTNSYVRWPNAAAHLMFPALYIRNGDYTEVHMMTSRDGLKWQRPLRQPVIPGGEPGTNSQGGVYAGCGLASFNKGEISLTYAPRRSSHNQVFYDNSNPEDGILTATWRQDGFVSLEADSLGQCSTVVSTFSGNHLKLNCWTRYGGDIFVELADAANDTRFTPSPAIPGHSFDDCDPISGDCINQTVTWQKQSDLSTWANKPIRIRFRMRRARIYSLQFV